MITRTRSHLLLCEHRQIAAVDYKEWGRVLLLLAVLFAAATHGQRVGEAGATRDAGSIAPHRESTSGRFPAASRGFVLTYSRFENQPRQASHCMFMHFEFDRDLDQDVSDNVLLLLS